MCSEAPSAIFRPASPDAINVGTAMMNFPPNTGNVMLRFAQHLCAHRERPFASLRVTSESSGEWVVFLVLVVKTHHRAGRGEVSHARPSRARRHKCRSHDKSGTYGPFTALGQIKCARLHGTGIYLRPRLINPKHVWISCAAVIGKVKVRGVPRLFSVTRIPL